MSMRMCTSCAGSCTLRPALVSLMMSSREPSATGSITRYSSPLALSYVVPSMATRLGWRREVAARTFPGRNTSLLRILAKDIWAARAPQQPASRAVPGVGGISMTLWGADVGAATDTSATLQSSQAAFRAEDPGLGCTLLPPAARRPGLPALLSGLGAGDRSWTPTPGLAGAPEGSSSILRRKLLERGTPLVPSVIRRRHGVGEDRGAVKLRVRRAPV
mmetsp:Transcript_18124/g.46419  ORF Transcript_18124/g.46419 Transcript_18124/m.46419 type:complete len:218 (-) Transcript_18124:593-1246(-)